MGSNKKKQGPIVITSKEQLGTQQDKLAVLLAKYRCEPRPALSIQITALRTAIKTYQSINH